MSPPPRSRRGVLTVAGSALAAGCLGSQLSNRPGGSPAGTPQPAETTTPPLDTPAPDGSWPQVGRSAARRGYNPSIGMTAQSVVWTADINGVVTTPTVVGDTIYVTRGAPEAGDTPIATVEAYSLDNGTQQWSQPLDVDFRYSGPLSNHRPIYYRGSLFVNVGNGVMALDASTGKHYWTTDLDVESDPPAVTTDGVFIAGGTALYCLSHDGSVQWQVAPEAEGDSHSEWGAFRTRPVISDNAVYLSVGGLLVALSPSDGSERWRETPSGSSYNLVRAADALVTTSSHTVSALNLDGTLRWEAQTGEHSGVRPAVAEETVYIAGAEGLVAAYDLASGAERWRTNVGGNEYAPGTIPVAIDDGVAVVDVEPGSDAEETVVVRGLAADSGEVQWNQSRRGGRGRGPIAASGSFVAIAQPLPGGDGFGEERPTIRSGGGDVTTTLFALRPRG